MLNGSVSAKRHCKKKKKKIYIYIYIYGFSCVSSTQLGYAFEFVLHGKGFVSEATWYPTCKATCPPTCKHAPFCDCVQYTKSAYGARLAAPPTIKPALCTYLPNQHNTTFIPVGPQGAKPAKASSTVQCEVKRRASLVSLV
jgi:hypothetical protein